MIKRVQNLSDRGKESCFLWGPRQTGKSTLLKELFPKSTCYDLLQSNEFRRLQQNPSLLREELQRKGAGPVIVDEIQLVPDLLNEVQSLIVNRGISFILCGSSARKLKKGGGNLLGGRALRYELFPFVSKEIPNFDLLRAINHGMIPRHYLAENPKRRIQSYVGDYLKEEIATEGLVRNLPAFSRFLEAAALTSGEMVNYKNVGSDCGVQSPTAKGYFQILEDTLIGRFIPSFRKRPKRRVILAPKFYLFDVGIINYLLKRESVVHGSELFGKAFEQFVYQELIAHSHYSGIDYPISYWRTASEIEVDFILGDAEVALEVKGVPEVKSRHLKGLVAFGEEYKTKKRIVVSLDSRPRIVGGIEILPWQVFLERLWGGEIF